MAYKLKRIGKKAYKFEYFLVLHSLSIEVASHKWSPNQVSIAFSRRGKRLYSKLLKWEPSINKPCHGFVVWPEPERMSTIVTLYKGQRDKGYESKEWEVSVVEVTREGRKKCLGRISLNMSNYAGDLVGSSQDMRLKLKPSGRKMKQLDLDCSLGSRFIRAGKSTDTDMHSQTSLMSVSQLSCISDVEDVDLTDFKDLDVEADLHVFTEAELEVVVPSVYYPPNYIQQDDLLAWSQKCVEGYHGASVSNFTTSWRSGLAAAAIIHRFRPDLLDFNSLQPHDVIHNNKIAFEASVILGVPRIIQPEQMESWLVPDRLSVTAFIYQLYIRLSPNPLSALSRSEPDSCELAESSSTCPTQDVSPRESHRGVGTSFSSPTSSSLQNIPGVNTSEPDKYRRTLPPIPKHSPTHTPKPQMRVKDFLSALDHSPNKARPTSPHALEKNRRSPVNPSSESPFFGRKANRKHNAASKFREESPHTSEPDQRAQKPLAHTASMEIKFKQIDSEFDSQDLFSNSLFRAVEQELAPAQQLVSPSPVLEMGEVEADLPQESRLVGGFQCKDSLLDILSDPCVIQAAKQQPRKKSLRQNKNPLLNNPLYSSQESDLSSSETSVIDSAAAIVPSKLTQAAPRPSPRPPARNDSRSQGNQNSTEAKPPSRRSETDTITPPGSSSRKEFPAVKPNNVKCKSANNEKDEIISEKLGLASRPDGTEVTAISGIKTVSKYDERKMPLKLCNDKKVNESETKVRVKKKSSLKKSESRELIGTSDTPGREKRLDEAKARIKSRRKNNRKRPEVKQCLGEPTLAIRRFASVSHIDKMSGDDTFQQESSDDCLSDQEGSRGPDKQQTPSSYQHVLGLEREAADADSAPTMLQLYNSRIAPGFAAQQPDPVALPSAEGRAVEREADREDRKGVSSEPEERERRVCTLSLSELCQNSNSSSSSSILCSEETDYVAHMQKKLCSMQISLDSRQAELRDRIREAEKSGDNELHNSLLEKWFQLIQQKAHLDNRYDDLILITETRDLAVKERLLRKELDHKMQIDRSIKSREQLWEEDVLCGEIVQIEKERRELEVQSRQQPVPGPVQRLQSVESGAPKKAQSGVEVTKKGQHLNWRDKLIKILA